VVFAAALSSLLTPINDLPLFWNRAPWLGIPLITVSHTFVLFATAFQLVLFLSTRLSQVREVNRELEASRDRVVALERERATRSERVRLQRELHDGLGAQLVGALAIAEREPAPGASLPAALRGALGELRVAVDSLDAEERELVEVLGSLRARLEPLVQGTGIEFSWRVGDVASARRIPPDHAIHLLRMLQEAIANAVKHASPGRIEVRSGDAARAGARVAFVEVQDDGGGFAAPAPGRGLENMRRRAEQIGGDLEVASGAGGTRVRLWLAPNV
jgi:signal transduction histidine kinase